MSCLPERAPVSSAEFRQFARPGATGKAERLFRAAVSAYCSLPRPTRREVAQLDDLALPLYPSVTPAARRFAAAALSECAVAPPLLVRRLADEPVEISAPLLVRSRSIADVDLITLIGRHGLAHARAIARRERLNPVIGDLLDALKDPEIRRLRGRRASPARHAIAPARETAPEPHVQSSAEDARRQLRAMMRPSVLPQPEPCEDVGSDGEMTFRRLRDSALSGHLPFFHTALADALNIDLDAAREITAQHNYLDLCAGLQRLELSEEQAFLLIAALFPAAVAGPESIRLFLYRYRRLAEAGAADPHDEIAAEPSAEPIRRAS